VKDAVFIYYTGGGGISTSLKVPRPFLLLLLAKVSWRKGKTLGNKGGRMVGNGNGLFGCQKKLVEHVG
jgi:hypothetical protein